MTSFTPKKRQSPNLRATIETLEPRILFSADVPFTSADPFDELRDDDGELEWIGTPNKISEARLEYVFIDRSTADYKILVDDLSRNSSGNTNYKLIFIESNENGIEKIAGTLATADPVDAIHIISHGSQGQVNVGNMSLSTATFQENLVFFEQWRAALKPNADLLFYGCELATNDSGLSLLASIAAATGADVAASHDLTGSSAKGGDWDLETEIGFIESVTPFSAAIQNDYSELLSTSPVLEWALETRVLENGSVLITNSQLHTSDIDNTDTDINYTVTTNPTNGFVAYASAPWPGAAITSFTQQDINDNKVVYVNTSGGSSDSFAFEVSDGTTTIVFRTLDFIVEPPQITKLTSGIEMNTDSGNDAFLQSDILTAQAMQGVTVELIFSATVAPLNLPIFTAHDGLNNQLLIAIDTTTGNLNFGVGNGPPSQSTTMDYRDILDNTPHSVALTWRAIDGSWSVLIDGELQDRGTGLNTGTVLDLSASRIELGNDISVPGPDSYFSGNYYDVRLWDYARSNSEIDHLSEIKLQNPDPRLIANWQMDNLDTLNKVDDTVSGNKLSVMHNSGAGFTTSIVRGDLNAYENSPVGTSLGYVLPHEHGVPTTTVVDGDFLAAGTPLNANSYSATQSIGDWNVISGQVDHLRADGVFSDHTLLGGNSVKLVDNTSSIEQTLITQPGRLYQLTYSVAGDFTSSTDPVTLNAVIGNQADVTSITHNTEWNLQTELQWQHRSQIIVANAANTLLSFSSVTQGALLADVRVTEISLEVASVLASQANMHYDSIANKFYKKLDQKSTALGAEFIAASQNIYGIPSRQVTIDSAYENARIHALTADLTDSIWLGANDATIEGDWRWDLGNGTEKLFWQGDNTSGIPVKWSYENWKDGEPNDYQPNGGEDYATMDQLGKWNDEPVTTGLNYLFFEWDAATVLGANQLSSVNGGGYSIDPLTGEVLVDSNAVLDYESAETENFDATVSYSDGHSDTHDVTVIVNNINEPPVASDTTIVVPEDSNYNFSIGDFSFSDVENNNVLSIIIRSLPGNGVLELSNNAVTLNQSILSTDIANLKFKPAADDNGINLDSFTFDVRDDGGTDYGGQDTSTTTGKIVFDVTEVNDAPTGTDNVIDALENTDYAFKLSDFGFSDLADGHGFAGIFVTQVSGSGTFVYNNSPVNSGQWLPVADIDADLLTYVPPPFTVGNSVAYISFTVKDDGMTTNGGVDTAIQENTITINVLEVKMPPTGSDKTISFSEDNVYTFVRSDFGFNDSDDDQFLSLTLDSLPLSGNLQLNNSTTAANQTITISAIDAGMLTYTTAQDVHGLSVANFDFSVVDDSGINDTAITPSTVFIDIESVNDAPIGQDKTVIMLEDTIHQFSIADFGYTDIESDFLQSIEVVDLPGNGTLKLYNSPVDAAQTVVAADINSLTYTPVVNAAGPALTSITFKITDDGGIANSGVDTDQTKNTVTINILSVNDAPSGTDAAITVAEYDSYQFSAADFGFSDSDGNSFASLTINSLPTAGTLNLNGDPVIAGQNISAGSIPLLTFDLNSNNGITNSVFQFQVQDTGGTANGGSDTAISNTITLSLTNVNQAPDGADTTITVDEDTPYIFGQSDFGFNDMDGNTLSAVQFSTIPVSGALTLAGTPVTSTQIVPSSQITNLLFTPATNTNGISFASVDFRVIDNGGTANGGTDTDQTDNTITFDINPVNDAPSGSDASITVSEFTSYQFSTSDFGFSDPESDGLASVIINTLPTTGLLHYSGIPIIAGQSISSASLSALTFDLASNNGIATTNFNFQVRDTGGTENGGFDTDQLANTITFTLDDVNRAPEGQDNLITINEDVSHTFSISDFGFSDQDSHQFLSIEIVSPPPTGNLTLLGAPVFSNQLVPIADLSGLIYTPASNDYGMSYASFPFKVRDDGGTANGGVDIDSTANVIVFDVLSVNDAPDATDRTIIVSEYSNYSFTAPDFTYTDTESDNLASVTIASLPTVGSLLLNGGTVASGDTISATQIGNLQYQLNSSSSLSNTTFNFLVQDTGGVTNSGIDTDQIANTITFDILEVNLPPSGSDRTIEIHEDTDYTFKVSDFGFSDPDGDTLAAIEIISLPAAGTLYLDSIPIVSGQSVLVNDINSLVFTPVINHNSSTSFDFKVQDSGDNNNGGANTDPTGATIIIDIVAVNDAPTGLDTTISTAEDNDYTFGVQDFGYTDIENDGFLGLTIETLPSGGVLLFFNTPINAGELLLAADINAGAFTFTPNPDSSGQSNFDFKVIDSGGTLNNGEDTDPASSKVIINVIAVSDAPKGTSSSINLIEDNNHTFGVSDFGFSDPADNDQFVGLTLSELPVIGIIELSGQPAQTGDFVSRTQIDLGQLKYIPFANDSSAGNRLGFIVKDGGNTLTGVNTDNTERFITLNIISVNDTPMLTANNISVLEGQTAVISSSDLFAIDIEDDASDLTFTVNENTNHGALSINGVTLSSGDTFTPTDVTNGSLRYSHDGSESSIDAVTLVLRDSAGASTQGVFQINIEDVVEAAPVIEPGIFGAIASGIPNSELIAESESVEHTSDEPSIETPADRKIAVEEIAAQDATQDITQDGTIGDSYRAARLDANKISEQPASPISLLNIETNLPSDPDYTGLGKFISDDYFKEIQVKQHRHNETLQLIQYNEESNLSAFTIDMTVPDVESMRVSENRSFQRGLDMVNETLDSPNDERKRRFEVANDTAVGASISITAGALAWMLRGGSIVAAMVSTTPLWGSIDPLRVFSSGEKSSGDDDNAVERMFDESE